MSKYNSVGTPTSSFLGSSSFKPIAGHVARDLFIFRLNQAKIADSAVLAPAYPVKLTNANGGIDGLGPNVFLAENITALTDISGFVVSSPSDVLEDGSSVAIPRAGQVSSVALIGSGIEIYLPCDNTLQNVNVNTKAVWDIASSKITKAGEDVVGNLTIVSGVLDGVVYSVDSNGNATTADSKVVLVRL